MFMDRIEAEEVKRERCLGYRAQQVLAYVTEQIANRGISPSYAEIRDALGLCSKGDVHRIIIGLEARRKLVRNGNGWGRKGVRVIRILNH
jgi:SOS-response transcriptional repressor LexA